MSGPGSSTGPGKAKRDWSKMASFETPQKKEAKQSERAAGKTNEEIQVHPIQDGDALVNWVAIGLNSRDRNGPFAPTFENQQFVAPSTAQAAYENACLKLGARGFALGLCTVSASDPIKKSFPGAKVKFAALSQQHAALGIDLVKSHAKYSTFGNVQEMPGVVWAAPINVGVTMIPTIKVSDILTMRGPEQHDLENEMIIAKFNGVNDKAIMTTVNGFMFKTPLAAKFPGGNFTKLKNPNDAKGYVWGNLWINPTFEADDVFDWFESFGCKVMPTQLVLNAA